MFHLLSYLSVSKVFQKPFVIWFFTQIYRNKRWEHFARPVNLLIKRYISKYLGIYEEDNRATSSLRTEIQRGRFRSGVSIQHFVTRLWKSGWLVTSFNAKFINYTLFVLIFESIISKYRISECTFASLWWRFNSTQQETNAKC